VLPGPSSLGNDIVKLNVIFQRSKPLGAAASRRSADARSCTRVTHSFLHRRRPETVTALLGNQTAEHDHCRLLRNLDSDTKVKYLFAKHRRPFLGAEFHTREVAAPPSAQTSGKPACNDGGQIDTSTYDVLTNQFRALPKGQLRGKKSRSPYTVPSSITRCRAKVIDRS